ncbi:MAG: hypothetical protein ACMXYF_04270 [Candidatus Woesearchaeota archaeon]
MMVFRAQTATEYLVISAVVIVIALIVVGAIGAIPSIGGGAGEQVDAVQLRLQDVGIVDIYEDEEEVSFFLLNNQRQSIRIQNVTFADEQCILSPVTVTVGSRYKVTCSATNQAVSDVKVTWSPIDSQTTRTTSSAISGSSGGGSSGGSSGGNGGSPPTVFQGYITGLEDCYSTTNTPASVESCGSVHIGQDGYHFGMSKEFDNQSGIIYDPHTECIGLLICLRKD